MLWWLVALISRKGRLPVIYGFCEAFVLGGGFWLDQTKSRYESQGLSFDYQEHNATVVFVSLMAGVFGAVLSFSIWFMKHRLLAPTVGSLGYWENARPRGIIGAVVISFVFVNGALLGSGNLASAPSDWPRFLPIMGGMIAFVAIAGFGIGALIGLIVAFMRRTITRPKGWS